MKTSKRIILLAALFALSLTSHAQRFEWAKTIDGYDQSPSDVGNKIAGSMTDSDGNLLNVPSPLAGWLPKFLSLMNQ